MNIDFNVSNNSIIDEPEGELDTQEKLDSMYYNLKRLGRTNNFNQNAQLNYKLPINKIPILDWVSSNAKYSSRYIWSAGSFQQADTLGNIIENTREYSLNTKLDISKFYDKVPILKNFNKKYKEKDTIRSIFQSRTSDGIMKLFMSLRSINLTYNVTERTGMAGVIGSPGIFGNNSFYNSPGWNFIFGSQDSEIRRVAAENGLSLIHI